MRVLIGFGTPETSPVDLGRWKWVGKINYPFEKCTFARLFEFFHLGEIITRASAALGGGFSSPTAFITRPWLCGNFERRLRRLRNNYERLTLERSNVSLEKPRWSLSCSTNSYREENNKRKEENLRPNQRRNGSPVSRLKIERFLTDSGSSGSSFPAVIGRCAFRWSKTLLGTRNIFFVFARCGHIKGSGLLVQQI